MQCYICYKAIEDGDMKTLNTHKASCSLYKGNQCSTLPAENTLGDEALKASMKAFPNFVKTRLPALVLILVLVGFAAYLYTPSNSMGVSVTGTDGVYISESDVDLKTLSNRDLVDYHNNFGNRYSSVEILNRAETVPADQLFLRASENPDLLIRVHGYITSMHTDFLFGSYITVGAQRVHRPEDIQISFDATSARIGDEVIMFLIPVFSGFDTPLRSWEWTQIRVQ